MPIRSRSLAVVAFVGLVLAFASCDKSPTSPRPPQQPGPSSPVTTVRLELVAPAEIAPDESVQLTANAIKSDGSVENVSGQAQWTPPTSEVLQLTSTGAATGRNRGEVFVTARFGGLSATARIFVLPKGTFRLAGSIKDRGLGIADATVTVLSGVGAGLTTRSGSDGSYALYGVSGPLQIHLKSDGYFNGIQHVDVAAHRTQDFEMSFDLSRNDFSGTYTLTISADSSCRDISPYGTFPDEARRRVYPANVAQDGSRLRVTLNAPDLIVTGGRGNGFFGSVDSTGVITFKISDSFYYYYYYFSQTFDIVERFSGRALLVSAVVSARGTPALISGTMKGAIVIAEELSPPFTRYNSYCSSNLHRFEMVRR